MNSKTNNTKKEALKIAKHYLQTLGFNGFSFQTIADALGIRKASLHYYFSSKEEMGIAILKEYEIAYKAWVLKIAELSAIEKLDKMLNLFIKLSEKNQMICPSGVLSSDYNTLGPKMKKSLKEFHLLQRDWIAKTIEQGKKEHTLRSNLDNKLTADWLLSCLQGGVQIARIRQEKDVLKKMMSKALEGILRGHV
jgi:TetR/AcrR family transcriptional repressor of nem operon